MTETLKIKQEQYIVGVTWLFVSFQTVQKMLRTSSLGHILVVCTVVHYATFNVTRVAYNNVYRALMGITRGYGHSISGEFCTNDMDGFHAVLKKKKKDFQFERSFIQECKYCCGFLCIFPRISCCQVPYKCAKWNMESSILWEIVI